ncbi:hypothetical protein BV898_10226 [Hypsibius exemplaris]|uniref:SP-RING-type domain-containing protein n=1 Tax=Hypsibius exemplaris TaxID=2072580 RepID=A0A1W0WKD3_HYPEX|nr:hypothetical protein BV898_10226 [Hypsibius exemplaris]
MAMMEVISERKLEKHALDGSSDNETAESVSAPAGLGAFDKDKFGDSDSSMAAAPAPPSPNAKKKAVQARGKSSNPCLNPSNPDVLVPVQSQFKKGQLVYAMQTGGQWLEAKIQRQESAPHPVEPDRIVPCFLVHFVGWGNRYDDWLMEDSLLEIKPENKIKMDEENAVYRQIHPPMPKKPKKKSRIGTGARRKTSKRLSLPSAGISMSSSISTPQSSFALAPLSFQEDEPMHLDMAALTTQREPSPVTEPREATVAAVASDAPAAAGWSVTAMGIAFRLDDEPFKASSFLPSEEDDIRCQPMCRDGMFLVNGKSVSPAEVVQDVLARRVQAKATALRLHSLLTTSDDDCGSDTAHLRLTCPLAKTRIIIPARGRHCQHIECFDAASFVGMNALPSGRWICPQCSRFAPMDELIVDEFFEKLLDFFKGDGALQAVWERSQIVVSEVTDMKCGKRVKLKAPIAVVDVHSESEDDSDDIIMVDDKDIILID